MNMGRKISDIYTEYKIMPVLQQHMFRVAAVASLICDDLDEVVNKEEIITACLLHDMGNIIKSKLEYFPQFNDPKGIEYWQGVKSDYVKKYGLDEHKATVQIVKELGLSDEIVKLVDQVSFHFMCDFRDGDDMRTKIVIYSDNRADPHGIVSYEGRMEEATVRYKDREDLFPIGNREKLIACGKDIEKQIFSKCKIKPEDINNETVAPVIESLKDFVVR